MGGKRIDCYLDITSLYSFLAFLDLERNREVLAAHNVEVEFHPVLLGAINAGSGNRPPWMLPAKARYGIYDAHRSIARFPGLNIQLPRDLMSMSKTVLPNRALHYIKRNHPPIAFLTILHYLLHLFWSPPNTNLTTAPALQKALSECPASFPPSSPSAGGDEGNKKLFSAQEVETIMMAVSSEEMKEALKAATQEALDKGAFGNPWIWATNGEGKGEPFFGSDRFHFVWRFLGLPYREVELLAPGEEGRAKL